MIRQHKIAIVGAGLVGGSAALWPLVSVVYLAIWLFIGPLWWMLLGYV